MFKYEKIQELIDSGGKVRKIGSEKPIAGRFLHTKCLIIDDSKVYSGSYNFTPNANTNFELFNELSHTENASVITNFQSWWSNSSGFFTDVIDPKETVNKLISKFNEDLKSNYKIYGRIEDVDSFVKIDRIKHELSDRDTVVYEAVKERVVLPKIRETVSNVVQNTHSINKRGIIDNTNGGVVSKPHRFYGGSIFFNVPSCLSNSYALAYRQKHYIELSFDFLKCSLNINTLKIAGKIKPEYCDEYQFEILFESGNYPKVFIRRPEIIKSDFNHVYSDGSLCLFYPPDIKWKDTTLISEYIIPWVFEWIHYYEIWKMTGVWEGEEKKH